jgi:hypothetical protein
MSNEMKHDTKKKKEFKEHKNKSLNEIKFTILDIKTNSIKIYKS